jgi:tetratricopeptide (TPR) repeat protein
MEIARNAGLLRQWGVSKINLVWSYWARGEFDKAAKESEELLQAAEDSSDQQLAAWGLLADGCIHLRRGLAKEANASFDRGIKIAKELPDYITLTGFGGWMGRSYLTLGEVERAIDLLEATQQLINDQASNLPGSAYLDNGLTEAYLAKAEGSHGQERLAWLKKTRPILQRTLKEARRNRFVLPDAQLLQGRYEWLNNRPEEAQKWWLRALAQAESASQRYNEGVIHLEVGKHFGSQEHLQRAESILEDIGAEFDLEMAREALANLGES